MKVDLIDHMGSDLTVVNAARVSFNKTSSSLTEKDIKLINYLAKHKHWSPFSHCFLQFRIKAPIFVARQLGKHQVGLAWNEVSRRYVDSEPEFYIPKYTSKDGYEYSGWRERADNVKQGSGDGYISNMSADFGLSSYGTTNEAVIKIKAHRKGVRTVGVQHQVNLLYQKAYRLYIRMLEDGIAPEQARMVLPQSIYTEWYWSGSLYAFSRMCKLRLDKSSQKEVQEIARYLSEHCRKLFPNSWTALMTKVIKT